MIRRIVVYREHPLAVQCIEECEAQLQRLVAQARHRFHNDFIFSEPRAIVRYSRRLFYFTVENATNSRLPPTDLLVRIFGNMFWYGVDECGRAELLLPEEAVFERAGIEVIDHQFLHSYEYRRFLVRNAIAFFVVALGLLFADIVRRN